MFTTDSKLWARGQAPDQVAMFELTERGSPVRRRIYRSVYRISRVQL